MKNTNTLEYQLIQFIYERLENVLWENTHKIKNYDKDEEIIIKSTELIREFFKGNKELDNIFCNLLDAYSDQLSESQIEAYKLGLKDGLNFKETIESI